MRLRGDKKVELVVRDAFLSSLHGFFASLLCETSQAVVDEDGLGVFFFFFFFFFLRGIKIKRRRSLLQHT